MFADYIATSGLTRAAWADKLGISRSYLSDLLNGNKTPSLELAVRINRETAGAVPAESWCHDLPALPDPPPSEDAA